MRRKVWVGRKVTGLLSVSTCSGEPHHTVATLVADRNGAINIHSTCCIIRLSINSCVSRLRQQHSSQRNENHSNYEKLQYESSDAQFRTKSCQLLLRKIVFLWSPGHLSRLINTGLQKSLFFNSYQTRTSMLQGRTMKSQIFGATDSTDNLILDCSWRSSISLYYARYFENGANCCELSVLTSQYTQAEFFNR